MIFAAFGACGRHLRRHRAQEYAGAGICRGRNMPPNEYAEKRKGGRSPEYSGTPPPLLSGKGPDAIW